MNPFASSLAFLLLFAPIADGWLGVYLDPDHERAVVAEVIPGSPAARAGLQAGDELLAVGDTATPTREALITAIRGGKAGEQLRIKVRRARQELAVTVQLAERPDAAAAPRADEPVPPRQGRPPQPAVESALAPVAGRKPYLGLRVRQVDDRVVIDDVLADGPAAALGVRKGETVTTLGDRAIRSLADLDAVLAAQTAGRKVPIGLRDDAGVRSLTITLGALPGTSPASRTDEPERAADDFDLEREVEALRRDLRQLRQQLEELRREPPAPKGRE